MRFGAPLNLSDINLSNYWSFGLIFALIPQIDESSQ